MKICVYAIAKDEAKFAKRFMDSAKDADYICVLDTGSTDRTPEILIEAGVIVEVEKIEPWRFDVARNRSMQMIPKDADVCICLDLDEMLCPGWREAIESAWKPETTRGRYRFIWSHDAEGKPAVEFYGEKIHTNKYYHWEHAAHEVLATVQEERDVFLPLTIEHWPDDTKSRANYLPLLEMDAKERPDDDRTAHYLGREYYFRGKYKKAIEELKRHLSLTSATWSEERCASMRYIAKCWEALGPCGPAKIWLYKACAESPTREPLVDMAAFLYRQGDLYGTAYFASEALKITEKDLSYITSPEAWGAVPHDLLSVAAWYTGDKKLSRVHAKIAYELAPWDERIKKNFEIVCAGG